MLKKMLTEFLCIFLLLGFSACGGEDPQEAAETLNEGEPIVIGVLPDTQALPFIVAEHLGYFEAEQVAVEIEAFTSAPDRDSALQSKAVNAVTTDLIAVALFRQSDLDLEAILSTDGSQQILASAQSNISSVEELDGKILTLSENTIMDYASDRILAHYGVAKDHVIYSYAPQITVRMEMLINGSVDAATMPEPQVSVAKDSGATVLASSADLGLNATCFAMLSTLTADHPDAVVAFVRAYNKAVAYLNETPREEYLDWLISEAGFPESVNDTLILPVYREATAPTEGDVTDVLDWMTQRELLTSDLTYADLVNIEFAR
ncbi:MAG TPA: MetQ/NlpA family ABC transporter substrate-binding protein [Clostridiales bacterium]|nr:MetQ/NlpA family ABC transporter substrate-binding protein [Clostridiales bacterium]